MRYLALSLVVFSGSIMTLAAGLGQLGNEPGYHISDLAGTGLWFAILGFIALILELMGVIEAIGEKILKRFGLKPDDSRVESDSSEKLAK